MSAAPTPEVRWRQRSADGYASILVVSQNPSWRASLVQLLDQGGYAVLPDASGDAAFDPACPFDLALVDLDLRSRAPLVVFAALRARSAIPIIATAIERQQEQAVLEAFANGADHLHVGLRSHELLARVRALLRRCPPRVHTVIDLRRGVGGITLDWATCVAEVNGRTVSLTRRECELLAALLSRSGSVVTRAQLAGRSRTRQADNALDALVRSLRAKLEGGEGRRRIVAVRGVGFRLDLVAAADHGRIEPSAGVEDPACC